MQAVDAPARHGNLLYLIGTEHDTRPQDHLYRYLPILVQNQRPPSDYLAHLQQIDSLRQAMSDQEMTVYRDARAVGTVRIRQFGLGTADFEQDVLQLETTLAPDTLNGTLLGSFDPDPESRFSRQEADADQRHALLSLAAALIDRTVVSQENVQVHVFRDSHMPKNTLAVLTMSLNFGDDLFPVGFLGIFEQWADADWQPLHMNRFPVKNEGDHAFSYALAAYGDFDRDSTLDFLLESTGYESWSYIMLRRENGSDWAVQPVANGGI